MKKFRSLVRYSELFIWLNVNPVNWRAFVNAEIGNTTKMYIFSATVQVGPLGIRLMIDDGRW